jgi:hypothetical protein
MQATLSILNILYILSLHLYCTTVNLLVVPGVQHREKVPNTKHTVWYHTCTFTPLLEKMLMLSSLRIILKSPWSRGKTKSKKWIYVAVVVVCCTCSFFLRQQQQQHHGAHCFPDDCPANVHRTRFTKTKIQMENAVPFLHGKNLPTINASTT